MLQKLQIRNYAIIDEINIEFSEKLNAITGETGAGKSILMGALSLILGERADSSVLLDREKKCFIEGVFTTDNKEDVSSLLAENDIDPAGEIILRREIGANGKSRAFVNDGPVNLDLLRRLSSLLVDLHQQFDVLELGESDFQRQVLDALAGQPELLSGYRTLYKEFSEVNKELAALQEQQAQFNKEAGYHQYLFDELQEASFKENELEELEGELKLLANSEGIKNALTKVSQDLKEGEMPVVQQLKITANLLQSFTRYHPDLASLVERLQSALLEIQDIAEEAGLIGGHINYDPQRIEQINERISAGYKLLKKHGVQKTSELLVIQNELEKKLQQVLDIEQTKLALEKKADKLLQQLKEWALLISKNRQAQSKTLELKVNQLLLQVGMPNARLTVQLEQGALNHFGMDRVEFLFDANKSNRPEPIRKVASGGELSRLMLCIKSLVAQSIDMPTLIFDEIDSGISGEAARQVGIILKDLSRKRQVICITHQPQIAGKADAHYFVYKETKGDAIKTNIRLLRQDERITTIAKMLSGEKPTAAALENAREMVTH
jgi:DNA repair protein RecN (Recombination protein N)